MGFTDREMKDFTQIAYMDFAESYDSLRAENPDRTSFTLRELINEANSRSSTPDIGNTSWLTNEQLDNWSISAVCDNNSKTGFYGCVIEDGNGNAAIAFRGSESAENPSNLIHDWIQSDFGLLNSVQTTQQQEVDRFLRDNRDLLNSYDSLSVTGHSLGGNLAEYATIVSDRYGLDNKIESCISFDGPGFSDEFIRLHSAEINNVSGVMNHYRWSVVGGLLFDLPGVSYTTCALADKEDDPYNSFTRHDTKYLAFDENGNVISGERDGLSKIMYPVSQLIETVPMPLNLINMLIMPFTMIQNYYGSFKEIIDSFISTAGLTYKKIEKALSKFFSRNNVYFKVNTAYLDRDSDDIDIQIERVRSYVAEMFNAVQNLSRMWRGPANTAFTAKFVSEKSDIDKYLNGIKDYVQSIRADSSAYISCEGRALDIIASLKV